MVKLYLLTPYGLGVVMMFVGSVMMWTIPFAIAGRGSRALLLLVLPIALALWICLGALVSNALGVSMQFNADNGMRAAAMVPLFFYSAMPVIACVTARVFGNWRAGSSATRPS